jgi:hypothetical protein
MESKRVRDKKVGKRSSSEKVLTFRLVLGLCEDRSFSEKVESALV